MNAEPFVLLWTKPKLEFRLRDHLAAEGHDVVCPIHRLATRVDRRMFRSWAPTVVERPLLPRYLFLRWADVRLSSRILSHLRQRDFITVAQDGEAKLIDARVVERLRGFVLDETRPKEANPKLRVGRAAKIVSGASEGHRCNITRQFRGVHGGWLYEVELPAVIGTFLATLAEEALAAA